MPGRPAASTLSPLLAGKIRRAPRWELVRELVTACRQHAHANGIDLPDDLGSVDAWRRRHEELVRTLDGGDPRPSTGELGRLLRLVSDGRPPVLGELTDSDFGVAPPLPGAAPGYIGRGDFDEEMRSMLSLEGPPYPFVLAYGEDGAGKTRSAVEAVRAEFPANTSVLIPRDGAALSELRSLADPTAGPGRPVLVWLDDLTAADLDQLTPELLDWLAGRAVTAGTIPARRCGQILEGTDAGATARAALHTACLVHLPLDLSDAERAEAVWYFESGVVPRSFAAAVADVSQTRELVLRLNTARSANPVGVALVRAAIDCQRAGLARGLTREELRRLLPAYLTSLGALPADENRFEQGLAWALDPVVGGRALLRASADGADGTRWTAAPELVGETDTGPVPNFLWPELLDMATPEECLWIGYQAEGRDAPVYAAVAFEKAMAHEECRTEALLWLGRVKRVLGAHTAARAAFRRVIETGGPEHRARAALFLGELLEQEEDRAGAEEAWRLAAEIEDESHAPAARFQLAMMLTKQNVRTQEAEALFRAAAASGHTVLAPRAWGMVAALCEVRGDLAGAVEAWERAAEWDQPDVSALLEVTLPDLRTRLAELAEVYDGASTAQAPEDRLEQGRRLRELGDWSGALAAFRAAAHSADPDVRAQALLGEAWILQGQGRTGEACEAFEAAAGCGVPARAGKALLQLGVLLGEEGDLAGAVRAWSRAVETDAPDDADVAALNLGLTELQLGHEEAAASAFLRAVKTPNPRIRAKAALNLAQLAQDGGADDDTVDDWYRTAVDTQDPEYAVDAAFELAGRLVGRGLRAEPRRLLRTLIETADDEWAARATVRLAMLHDCDEDVNGAAALYREAIALGHADYSTEAHLYLGRLCLRTYRDDAARWHLRTALDAGHPDHSPEAGLLLARIHEETGDLDAAELLLRQLAETGHATVAPQAGELLADVLARNGRAGQPPVSRPGLPV
jgi:tetratricopeptide (TPR) repeat protein